MFFTNNQVVVLKQAYEQVINNNHKLKSERILDNTDRLLGSDML